MKVITREHRWWDNLPIPSLDFEKLQYLGVHIRHDGKIALPRSVWKTKLEPIMPCYLTPIQKVQVLRQSICSIILFQLRLSDHGLEDARKINRLIRGAVKRILHLPSWTSSDWLHHHHGANIPDILVTTMTVRKRASEKMKLSKDPISRYVADQIDHINGDRLRHLKISDTGVAKKIVTSQRERMVRQNNGCFMVTTFASKTSRAWLWTRRGLKVGDKIRAIQALSCPLPTTVNKTRGNPDLTAKRCKCRKSIEDDAHVLNSCELNHKLIIKRHDHLVSKIAKQLKREHPTAAVWIERHWRRGLQLVKPDITMINERHCIIIEFTCPYESSIKYLYQRAQDKVNKYQPLLQDLQQVDCQSGEIISQVIGSLGTITSWTNAELRELKLSRHKEALQMTVIKGSVNILNHHLQRDDF